MPRLHRAIRRKRLTKLIAAFLCLLASRLILDHAYEIGRQHNLYSRSARASVPPEYILTASLLGGFRGIFITALWMNAQEMKENGRYYEMVDLYRIISTLQPSHAAAWRYQAWDLTYNVSAEFNDDRESRIFWVFRGIDLLRKEAIPKNPNMPELYWELSWYFRHKIASDIDDAYLDYQTFLAQQVDETLRGLPPESWRSLGEIADLLDKYEFRDDLLDDEEMSESFARLHAADPELDVFKNGFSILTQPPLKLKELLTENAVRTTTRRASLWKIGQDIKERLGMDPREMFLLHERFGPIDWRRPVSHALYWASLGEKILQGQKTDEFTTRYRYLIYRAAMDLLTTQEEVVTGDGVSFFPPQYQFLDQAIGYSEATLANFDWQNAKRAQLGLLTVDVETMRSTYVRFLLNVTVNAHLDDQRELASSLLDRAAKQANDDSLRVPTQTFVKREVSRRLIELGRQGTLLLLKVLYSQACVKLEAEGEVAYRYRLRRLGPIHEAGQGLWGDHAIPALPEIQRTSIHEFLAHKSSVPVFNDPSQIRTFLDALRNVEPTLFDAVQRPQRDSP